MNIGKWIRKHPYSFIGKKVVINESSYIGGNPLEIKDNTVFKGFLSTRGNANITFGSNCVIGSNLFIIASYKPISPDYFKGMILLKNKKEGPVYIGNNVQIGDDVIILPGVTIGDGVVIKSRSVVTDDLVSTTKLAKNPPRLFKTNKIILNDVKLNNFLMEGWGYLESGGRWVVNNQAGFMFDCQDSPLTLNFKGFSYIKSQKITIYVNNKKAGDVQLGNSFNTYKIAIKNLNKGVNYFKVVFQHFSRPNENDKKSSDARKLYCFFEEIFLS